MSAVLKFAVVAHGSGNGYSILMRCESLAVESLSGYEAESYIETCANRGASWTRMICRYSPYWFDNNEPMKHWNGEIVKLFIIHVNGKIVTYKTLVHWEKHMCSNVSMLRLNKDGDLLWKDNPVWAEVLGCQQAYRYLVGSTEIPYPGYYEKHRRLVHEFFHLYSICPDIAELIHSNWYADKTLLRRHLSGPCRRCVAPDDMTTDM
jgi:hypothetical protein